MKISDLIAILETIKAKHGDIEVKVQTLSHVWDPDPIVRESQTGYGKHLDWVLLNP